MIGGPNLLLLDEPSSGLDPAARRSMWKIVDGVRGDGVKAKRSIVLTTHSMEECEALCSRIGIMVVGKLQCLGSATRLKATYGQGWHVEVNVARVGADGRAPNLSDALSMLAVGLEEADAAAADEGGADDGGMFLPPPRPPTPAGSPGTGLAARPEAPLPLSQDYTWEERVEIATSARLP